MAIYRGAGGAGDAVNDSSSEASAAVIAQAAAQAAAIAAEAAKVAAQLAETNAETAETNAETAETNAETAASNALTSANNASNSAVSAASSASAASSSASSASISATNAANSSTTAAGSASAAAISATAASNSASSASGYATTASNAATSATASAASATASEAAALASKNAAATSATNAASSASTANSAATTATTQAGIATTQATNAANSASAASTSATNAASSASAASTSASNASTSATNAATSATASANSATASAAARDAALAALDSFDDRYLGTKSADPTLDNDGNALVAGALYFNTVSNSMKVYDGSLWLAAYASLSGALLSANNLSDLNNAATSRTNLGVTATGSDTTYAYRANNLSDLANAATARTNLGLGTAATTAATDYATAAQGAKADTALQPAAIGVTVQGYDADLAAFALKTAPSGTVVGTSDTQTLTNKTVNLLSNTLTGTTAQFNTALSDGDFATLAGTETLTNKTISGASNTLSNIGNSSLTNSSITIGGSAVSLGGTVGTLGVAYGGTGLTSLTAGYIPYGNGTGALSSSANLTFSGTALTITGTTYANGDFYAGTASAQEFSVLKDGTNAYLNARLTGGALIFRTNGSTEQMRITSAGNVGIGTSSPSFKLDIQSDSSTAYSASASGSSFRIANTNTAAATNFTSIQLVTDGNGRGIVNLNALNNAFAASADFTIQTRHNATLAERLRLTSDGNLGLGVTPSAWYSLSKAIDIGAGGAIEARSNTATTFELSTNAYLNSAGNWTYKGTGVANLFGLSDGTFKFYNAASGTAGTAITFTQAMTLDASGNLGIGKSSPSYRLDVYGGALNINNGGSAGTVYFVDGAGYINYSSSTMQFSVNSAERMRIDSSGNVGIGTSSPTSFTNSKVLEVAGGSNTGAVLASSNSGTVVAEMQGNNGDGLVYYGSRTNHPVVTRVNGVERMRIGSDGGVMVGTTTSPGAGLISDSKGEVRSIPQNAQTAAYTLVAADNGKHISITTGGVTVNASVFSAGQVVTIYNNSGSNQTITQGTSVTMRQAGTANTGNRTLAQYGVATILCITGGATPTFVISGAGLS